MPDRFDTIRQLLSQGPMQARQLIEKMNISQPTLSRALRQIGDDLVRFGAGPLFNMPYAIPGADSALHLFTASPVKGAFSLLAS